MEVAEGRFAPPYARKQSTLPLAPDHVKRKIILETQERIWVADITYISTREKRFYLSVVLDIYSRKVVGWSIANTLKTELVLDTANAMLSTLTDHRPDDPSLRQ